MIIIIQKTYEIFSLNLAIRVQISAEPKIFDILIKIIFHELSTSLVFLGKSGIFMYSKTLAFFNFG